MQFPPAKMASLVDDQVQYELGESTCPPLRIRELLDEATLERLAECSLGYGPTPGDPELRDLIAADVGVDPDSVLITAGGISAMFLLAFVLCEPGDEVVLTTPCFPPARTVPEALQTQVRTVPLRFEDGYRLDVEAIAAALTPKTRLVSLASPQNPSGVRFSDEELLELVSAVEASPADAVVLVDETYRATTYGDVPIPASAAGLSPRIVTCASLSKSHGAPGLRVGWLTTGRPDLYERLRVAKFNTLISGSAADELLAGEVFRRRESILAARSEVITEALSILEAWAGEQHELVEFLRPDGGALCCLRLRPERFDTAAVERFYTSLAGHDTRVAPGSWFGESDQVFRVGFGHLPLDVFAGALERVADAMAVASGVVEVP